MRRLCSTWVMLLDMWIPCSKFEINHDWKGKEGLSTETGCEKPQVTLHLQLTARSAKAMYTAMMGKY